MIKLHYEYNNLGSSSTIVFLHGWGLSGDSFNPIINRLKNVSILKVDFYGFGKSSQPKTYFDTYEYAYQIFLLLKKLNIDNVVFVGHSFGGRIAIVLSGIFKIYIKGLVLTSSAGINKFKIKIWLKIKYYKLLKLLNKLKIISNKRLEKFGSNDYKNADNIMQKILIKVVNQDLKFLLKNITVKTLLVWDKNDKDTPYYIAKILNKNILKSKIILYGYGGHFVAFRNANKFSGLLNKLLINV